ncbi:MAG TPA: hypothetical protein VFY87_13125 [Geminicoccaceae bacterium]|jgi:hypothetical protein|nr:hypothetical protein [Geminicoccaceae bacterium]
MEKATDPVPRCDLPQLAGATGHSDAVPASAFAATREVNDGIKS